MKTRISKKRKKTKTSIFDFEGKSDRFEIIRILKNGGIGVMPTDTIYGLVGSAFSKTAVRRAYRVRRRNSRKPFIILIYSTEDLPKFSINLDSALKRKLNRFWPGKVSVILPCPNPKFKYLHRGAKSLAFRVPKTSSLRKILKVTGPLFAPSANLEGFPPARNLEEAIEYFGSKVDFYAKGKISDKPSRIIYLNALGVKVVRE